VEAPAVTRGAGSPLLSNATFHGVGRRTGVIAIFLSFLPSFINKSTHLNRQNEKKKGSNANGSLSIL
jgi:hypothetical protein